MECAVNTSRAVAAQLRGQGFGGGGDGAGEHLDEERVVEIGPQLDQLGSFRPRSAAGPGNVLDILGAAGIAAPRGGREHRGAANAVVPHRLDAIFDVGFPVAVAEIHRQAQLGAQPADQRAVDPVHRRHATEMQVVLRYFVKAFGRNVASPGDVLQKRPHLLGPFRPAEGQQQGGVKFHCVL